MFEAMNYQKEKVELWVLHTFIDLMESSPAFQQALRGSHRLYQSARQAWPTGQEWLAIAAVFSVSLLLGYAL